MINQFWEKPYNPEDTIVTVKDWNNYLAPNIKSEILTQINGVELKISDIDNNYVRKTDYYALQSQYYHLLQEYKETMEILAIKGIITEDDIKEFKESRRLAKTMAKTEIPDNLSSV